MSDLILSLFPGIGLLDMAFEEAGFCVVRGPDLLWGGDIKRFHPPAGKFDGVIGGPPCQAFSAMAHLARHVHGPDCVAPNLIPEFERCVAEAAPCWFLMENVPAAPVPVVGGYGVDSFVLNNRWFGGEQHRKRRFSFGMRGARVSLRGWVKEELFEPIQWSNAVMASGDPYKRKLPDGRVKVSNRGATVQSVAKAIRLQGLPADFLSKAPFTVEGKQRIIGNGVPLPLGANADTEVLG